MNKKILIILVLVIAVIGIGGLLYFNPLDKAAEDTPKAEVENPKDEVIVAPVEEPVKEAVTTEIAKGKPAPNFTLKNLSGEEVSLSDYKGKFVLINFWATWCGYCDMEMPDLQKVDKENDDLVVLAVDVMEDLDIVEEYINEGGYDFEVVLDSDGEIAKTYLVGAYPTSYFIDEDGVLLGGIQGMMTYERMNEVMDNIRN